MSSNKRKAAKPEYNKDKTPVPRNLPKEFDRFKGPNGYMSRKEWEKAMMAFPRNPHVQDWQSKETSRAIYNDRVYQEIKKFTQAEKKSKEKDGMEGEAEGWGSRWWDDEEEEIDYGVVVDNVAWKEARATSVAAASTDTNLGTGKFYGVFILIILQNVSTNARCTRRGTHRFSTKQTIQTCCDSAAGHCTCIRSKWKCGDAGVR